MHIITPLHMVHGGVFFTLRVMLIAVLRKVCCELGSLRVHLDGCTQLLDPCHFPVESEGALFPVEMPWASWRLLPFGMATRLVFLLPACLLSYAVCPAGWL
jgi:hypothetical protein